MGTPRPRISSRTRRLVAYLGHNRWRMAVDATMVAAWLLATSTIFDALALPSWSFYVVLFAGVVIYSRITPTWERPYRSPN